MARLAIEIVSEGKQLEKMERARSKPVTSQEEEHTHTPSRRKEERVHIDYSQAEHPEVLPPGDAESPTSDLKIMHVCCCQIIPPTPPPQPFTCV